MKPSEYFWDSLSPSTLQNAPPPLIRYVNLCPDWYSKNLPVKERGKGLKERGGRLNTFLAPEKGCR